MPNCDLAFENSTVEGNIIGEIDFIENLRNCNLRVGKVKNLVKGASVYPVKVNIEEID